MNKLPNNIKDLMTRDAYTNLNNPNHENVAKQVKDYFNQKYGKSFTDSTGRNISVRTVWVWHAIDDEKTCDDCASFADKIYEHQEEIPNFPHHINCRCWIEECEVDDNDKPIGDERRDKIILHTMAEEGGYVDNPNLIDQPTNAGITKGALDRYNTDHPNFNFPHNVRELTPEQAVQIYKEDYYDERRINEIENDRIAGAIFDMGVMSKFSAVSRIVQETLNENTNTKLAVDGIMGNDTINALNNIPNSDIAAFMDALKEKRLEYLAGLSTWNKYGDGWTARTERY